MIPQLRYYFLSKEKRNGCYERFCDSCQVFVVMILYVQEFDVLYLIIYFELLLEHNFFKNVSKSVIFLWKTQIQTIKCGLDDTKKINKKKVIVTIY